MPRLLVICTGVGLLCGALGCKSSCEGGHVHGRCDCDDGPAYGCHYDNMVGHGDQGNVMASPAPAPMPPAETLKPLPKEVMPTDDVK